MNKVVVINGYIVATASTPFGSDNNADVIEDILRHQPSAQPGYTYKLRADNLEWELVELPPVPEPEMTDDAALTRYANELTNGNAETLQEATETLIKKLKEGN